MFEGQTKISGGKCDKMDTFFASRDIANFLWRWEGEGAMSSRYGSNEIIFENQFFLVLEIIDSHYNWKSKSIWKVHRQNSLVKETNKNWGKRNYTGDKSGTSNY